MEKQPIFSAYLFHLTRSLIYIMHYGTLDASLLDKWGYYIYFQPTEQKTSTSAAVVDITGRSPKAKSVSWETRNKFSGWNSADIGFSGAALTHVAHRCPVLQLSAPLHWSELTETYKAAEPQFLDLKVSPYRSSRLSDARADFNAYIQRNTEPTTGAVKGPIRNKLTKIYIFFCPLPVRVFNKCA